ncbi:hypothetical protein BN7_2408 [Wickerhamomyces ciferrii]|uniref:Uncharacterized protein n=1 Tax=Wickerhamomyces ciferrii (strain ATCC 14091 / BCRC 22168 / CBS 111 / JCM 3599 / NBRC 0793 / NRRL Y-1031 F-60-10) TaxID=1206466 RepID=K0KP27_WICCF|nr:uncharacterized protein BN7_2408 [Wickerhamomyces ciferrii]CCH42863.1 hypothetical protein BN7_2408 [Wickerhamomyces ciferrii]
MNIKAYLDESDWKRCLTVFMRSDLNISQILTYLNKFDLKSDKEIDDHTSKINSERLPRFFMFPGTPQFLRIFLRLMNFYSNSLESRANYTAPQELIAKITQRQKSNYMSIEGTVPHRNFIYFFGQIKPKNKYKCEIDDYTLKNYSQAYDKIKFDNPYSYDHSTFTVYDMECANDKIYVNNKDNQLSEKESLPKYSK